MTILFSKIIVKKWRKSLFFFVVRFVVIQREDKRSESFPNCQKTIFSWSNLWSSASDNSIKQQFERLSQII